MKLARRSFGGPYQCLLPWPDDAFVQCGGKGIVVVQGGEPYQTAFFEAFPDIGDDEGVFIRGEGPSIEDAEQMCWEKYQRHVACPTHEYEPRGYKNGCGFCKHCGMFKSGVFPPSEKCQFCGAATYWGHDKRGQWYCEACADRVAESDLPEALRLMRAAANEPPLTIDEIESMFADLLAEGRSSNG